MFLRHIKLDLTESHLILGARGTGKSTFFKSLPNQNEFFFVDLLKPSEEDLYIRDPKELTRQVQALNKSIKYVVIDEIQKVPKLLDVCHSLIEETSLKFFLTGSSARKLKRGSSNLLAGRALASFLYPLTSFELGDHFDLKTALQFGTLPKIWNTKSDTTRRKFLETYALTYIKEEIQTEQIVRAIDPFRRFLEVAAQMNGKILNFARIANDVGVDEKTVRNYFQILEDTLLGFFLEAFDSSVRKRVRKSPKFFFIDTGVQRALARLLTIPIKPMTRSYGDAFEHFIFCEMKRLISYSGNQFELSYLRSSSDVEIDVICERPGSPLLLIEIKSTDHVTPPMTKALMTLGRDIAPEGELVLFSNDPHRKKIDDVLCYPWQDGLKTFFSGPDLIFSGQ